MKKRNGGFTLVELMVVLSIFTLLLVIIVPSLNSILGFRVQKATNSIGAALNQGLNRSFQPTGGSYETGISFQ